MPDSITVIGEEATFVPANPDTALFPRLTGEQNAEKAPGRFYTSFEERYERQPVFSKRGNEMAYVPVLIYSSIRPDILITEADIRDYPGMFLCGSDDGSGRLNGCFAPYPLDTRTTGYYPQDQVTKTASYIAHTIGSRTFPWRIASVAGCDARWLESDLVYRLGEPQVKEDFSWLKPGKSQSEWLNDNNIYGVDFRSGANTNTYKYYIDFAAKFGMAYVLFDAGWSDPGDIFSFNPDMDMEELVRYALEKNVGLVLWTSAHALSRQMEKALDLFQKWGIKGIMVDFMNRDDQEMVDFYWRTAEETAKRHLFVDFHGAYKPDGLCRTYPNAITREGAMGQEYYKFSDRNSPDNEIDLLFTRMVAGPYDYEPGNMRNSTAENFKIMSNRPESLGTRIHQMALCVVLESPYSKLGGNVSDYLKEPEYTRFLVNIPTVWDETIGLEAKAAEYAVMARKAADGDWYVGAITNWSPRDPDIDFSFLPDDQTYNIEIYRDGVNADRYAEDYRHIKGTVTKASSMKIHLAPGGGWVARISAE